MFYLPVHRFSASGVQCTGRTLFFGHGISPETTGFR
ncbi:hypothetical protein LUU34_00090400 [Aix galericulata]|nr:hypothetical protein LUU34_00090400 [Aix galericulata]